MTSSIAWHRGEDGARVGVYGRWMFNVYRATRETEGFSGYFMNIFMNIMDSDEYEGYVFFGREESKKFDGIKRICEEFLERMGD